MTKTTPSTPRVPRLYDDDGDHLIQADKRSARVILLPSGNPRKRVPTAIASGSSGASISWLTCSLIDTARSSVV